MKWVDLRPGDVVLRRGGDAYLVLERTVKRHPIGTTFVAVTWLSSHGLTEGWLSHDEITPPEVVVRRNRSVATNCAR